MTGMGRSKKRKEPPPQSMKRMKRTMGKYAHPHTRFGTSMRKGKTGRQKQNRA